MAAHIAIRNAIVNLLVGGTPVAAGRVYPNRNYALPQGVDSQVNAHRVQSVPNRGPVYANAPIDWTTDMRLVVSARYISGGSSAEDLADAIAVDCVGRVLADQTLAGLCDAIEPGQLTWDQDEADGNLAQITWDFQVVHRTFNNVIS
ncbi:hypothetical protein ACFPOE_11375 [Caenimonas terrae]|uniref:DUF3168 domain-containing protein n=1 Tax=Caenimonas terrae TaxID=696074 RepID=A0ABW0NGJ5_9BURK